MPTVTRRRKPPQEPEAAAPVAPNAIEAEPAVRAKPLQDLEFFDHLRLMSARDWEDRICYLYRGGSEVAKADPTKGKYIDKIGQPFDEAYVKQKFGGGRYLAILKNLREGDAERKYSFEVDGPPKLQPDEVLRPAAPAGEPAPAPPPDPVLNRLVDQAVEAWRGRALEAEGSRAGHEDDPTAIVADTMRRAAQAAIEIVREARPPDAGGGGVKQLAEMMGVLKDLGLVAAPPRQNPASPLRELFGELKDVFGIEPAALLGGAGGGADWRAALVSQAPQLFATVRQALEAWDRHTQINFRLAMQGVQPALPAPAVAPPAAAPAAAAPPPSAAAAPGRTADGSIDFEWVRGFVSRQFAGDRSGEFAAALLRELFPDAIPLFAAAFGDAAAVAEFVKSDSVLSAIANAADGDEFIREFAAEMLRAQE